MRVLMAAHRSYRGLGTKPPPLLKEDIQDTDVVRLLGVSILTGPVGLYSDGLTLP